jgi:hypothetical protein
MKIGRHPCDLMARDNHSWRVELDEVWRMLQAEAARNATCAYDRDAATLTGALNRPTEPYLLYLYLSCT